MWRFPSAAQPVCHLVWAGEARVPVTFPGWFGALQPCGGALRSACLVHRDTYRGATLLVTCMLADLEGGEGGGLCQVEPWCCITSAAGSHSWRLRLLQYSSSPSRSQRIRHRTLFISFLISMFRLLLTFIYLFLRASD